MDNHREGGDITELLSAAQQGESDASEQLFGLAYDELKAIAAHKMAGERAGHTLQATALVHEAYLRLFESGDSGARWNSRGHFFGSAAEAMRRILIESARRRVAQKRGAGAEHTAWDDSGIMVGTPPQELLAIDEALGKLEEEDPGLATVVKLRYFAGMTIPETASALETSPRSINRQWECARAWLYREISESD